MVLPDGVLPAIFQGEQAVVAAAVALAPVDVKFHQVVLSVLGVEQDGVLPGVDVAGEAIPQHLVPLLHHHDQAQPPPGVVLAGPGLVRLLRAAQPPHGNGLRHAVAVQVGGPFQLGNCRSVLCVRGERISADFPRNLRIVQCVIAAPAACLIVGKEQVGGQLVLAVVGVGPEGVAVDPFPGVALLLVEGQGGDPPAAGVIGVLNEPVQGLEIDGHGQLFGAAGIVPEGFIVVQLPYGPRFVLTPLKVRVDGVNVHPAGGHDGIMAAVPVLPILRIGRGGGSGGLMAVAGVPLYGPLPGHELPVEADYPRLTVKLAVFLAVEGVEQAVFPVIAPEGDHLGDAGVAGALEYRVGHLPGLLVHDAQNQGVLQVVLHKDRPQNPAVLLDVVHQLGGGGLELVAVHPLRGPEQGLQQLQLFPAQVRVFPQVGDPGGLMLRQVQGDIGRLGIVQPVGGALVYLSHLTGHQIAAEDTHGKDQGQKQRRGPLLGSGEDIFQSQLHLPRRAGQGGGKGCTGSFVVHKCAPFCFTQSCPSVPPGPAYTRRPQRSRGI